MISTNTRFYLGLLLAYVVGGSVFFAFMHPTPLDAILELIASIPKGMAHFATLAWWSFPILAVFLIFAAKGNITQKLLDIFIVTTANVTFWLVFISVKATLPSAMAFWADPLMANLDVALHGTDPYRITHVVLDWLPIDIPIFIYTHLWYLPACFLPVWLTIFDNDSSRVRRYMFLHAFAWIVLGNIFALAFMSAGPIYYDALLGTDRFADLAEVIASSGIADTPIGYTQTRLWESYVEGTLTATSGISAFPSVHVGMAAVVCLYLAERFRYLTVPAIGLVLSYEIASVHLGWHYAVDGYFSVAVVCLVWFILKRQTRPNVAMQQNNAVS